MHILYLNTPTSPTFLLTHTNTLIFYYDVGGGVVLEAVSITTGGIWETHWSTLLLQLLELDLKEKHIVIHSHT